MRTLTVGEEAAILAGAARTYRRLEIEDAIGGWEDFSDAFVSRSGGTSIDQSVIDMRFEIRRSITGGASLSPFVSDAIDAGRDIRYYTATVAAGAPAPAPGDYRLVFYGEIDSVDAANDPISITASDKIGAMLAERDIRDATRIEADGMTLEAVMQELLDQWGDAIVLNVPVASGVTLTAPVLTEKGKLLEALRQLAGRIGWTLRPMWNETAGEFQLTFYEPPRAKATVDLVYPPSRYLPLRKLAVDRAGIRNQARISYLDAATGERLTEEDEDAVSVARFGPRWMEFIEADTSPINSAARAQDFLAAAISDTATPPADLAIEVMYNWAADLDDRYTFGLLARYFTTDQTLAVVGYRHEESMTRERTTLTLRGKPTGALQRWKMPQYAPTTKAELLNVRTVVDTVEERGEAWEWGTFTSEVWIWDFLFDHEITEDEWPDKDNPPIPSVLLLRTDTPRISEYVTAVPADREIRYVQIVAYDAAGRAGDVIRLEIPGLGRYPKFLTPPRIDGTTIEVNGDEVTRSIRLDQIDDLGALVPIVERDGRFDTFTVPVPSGQTWQVRVTLQSVAASDVDGSTFETSLDVQVSNGATGEPVWDSAAVDPPALADDTVTLTLEASAAPVGYAARAYIRYASGDGVYGAWTEITSLTSPAMSAPPTAATAYTYDTTRVRIASGTPKPPVVQIQIDAEIDDASGNTVATISRYTSWFEAVPL